MNRVMSWQSLATHAAEFNHKLAMRRTMPRQPPVRASAPRGSLRRKIANVRSSLPDLINVFRCVLYQMCCLSYSDWQRGGDAWCTWDYRWKGVSREGIDMVGNRVNEYRNLDHRAVLQWLYQQDTECAKLIDWLADWWAELHPIDAKQRKQPCLEIQGDVIRITLAALRGNRCFDLKSSPWLTARYSQPALFMQVCELCMRVQYLDAAVDSGWAKGTRL